MTTWTPQQKNTSSWTPLSKSTSSWTKSTTNLSQIDGYSSSNFAFSLDFLDSLDASGVGMTFTTTDAIQLKQSQFFLTRLGTPTGTMRSKLYSITGVSGSTGVPNTLIATSSGLDVSTINLAASSSFVFSDYATYSFTFNTLLSANTSYVITLEYSGGGVGSYISIGGGDHNLPQGNPVENFGSWTPFTGDSYCFAVLGQGTWTNLPKS